MENKKIFLEIVSKEIKDDVCLNNHAKCVAKKWPTICVTVRNRLPG